MCHVISESWSSWRPPIISEEDSIRAYDKYATPVMSIVPAWWAGPADLWYILCMCQRVWGCQRVSVCWRGWSRSFQGDFNIYCCLPLWWDVSSEVNVSPFASSSPFLFFSPSTISSHQSSVVSLLCPPLWSVSPDWYFCTSPFCFENFPPLTFVAAFFSRSASFSMPLFVLAISVYSFQKTMFCL